MIQSEKKETDIDIPDMLTILKILKMAAHKTYQPIILFALLINELGVMSHFL
jgi:hypothetical protein